METGGFRCRETAETDLTIAGAKETRQKKRRFWIYHSDVDGGGSYDSKTIPTTSGRWKIIRYHWVKEIDNDWSVNASSLWYKGKKLINFFCNSWNRGRVRVGDFHKNSWGSFSFFSFIKTLFFDGRTNQGTPRLLQVSILILEKSSLEQSTRLSG